MDIEIIVAQFGDRAAEFEPGLSSFKEHFPDAKTTLYSDKITTSGDFDEVNVQPSQAFAEGSRYGNRMNDYYKVFGLMNSKADVAIAIDTDTKIVSESVVDVLDLAGQFGLCLPVNPRHLVGTDACIGTDGDKSEPGPMGLMHAVNMTPIVLKTDSDCARMILALYLALMGANPRRGPLVMAEAIYQAGLSPCLLPPQWCVCAENIGIGDEIILHVGHRKVAEYYA